MTHPVHWQRGAFRMWVVASAAWIGAMGWSQYHEPKQEETTGFSIQFSEGKGIEMSTSSGPVDANPAECDNYFDEQGRLRKLTALIYHSKEECIEKLSKIHRDYRMAQLKRAAPVFMPPLALLLLFPIGGWIRKGFKK
jgi:hypothetical protein